MNYKSLQLFKSILYVIIHMYMFIYSNLKLIYDMKYLQIYMYNIIYIYIYIYLHTQHTYMILF